MSNEGLLVIISAPSGAGKTSLCEEVLRFFPELRHSVSHTTRAPRPGEKDGVDYQFVSEEKFKEMIDSRRFAEWAEIHGNRYGTAANALRECLLNGNDVILDLDGQGARQIKDQFPDSICVYILPPSLKELEERLRSRGTDSNEEIKRRLENAKEELGHAEYCDYIVINDDFDEAVSALRSIIVAEKCRRKRVLKKVEALFNLSPAG